MRLERLQMVNQYAEARKALTHAAAVVQADQSDVATARFRIIIDGQLQDEQLLAVTRPVVVSELQGRIDMIDKDLASLGVDVENA